MEVSSDDGKFYSAVNSTGATQRFSVNHKASSEQKNRDCSFFRANYNRGLV